MLFFSQEGNFFPYDMVHKYILPFIIGLAMSFCGFIAKKYCFSQRFCGGELIKLEMPALGLQFVISSRLRDSALCQHQYLVILP